MRGALTGDLDALTDFGEAIGQIGGPSAQAALGRALGDEAVKMTELGFARQQDPYGVPWPNKFHPDGRKTLDGATHKLAKSFSVRASGAWGAIIGSNLSRSRFQQSGTGLYGPRRSRIRSTSGKVMAFRGAGGGMVFTRSTRGQQQRRLVPVQGIPSPFWNRALRKRAAAHLNGLLAQTGGKVTKIAA